MILENKQSTVAYRCPSCGKTVKSMIGAFSLSGDLLRLKCPCGESDMTIERRRDKKIRLTIPCFLCPRPHVYTVSESIFFGREVFAYPCSYTGVDIGFSGDAENVERAVEESDLALEDMLGDAEYDDIAVKENERVFDDPQILDIILFVIGDLAEEGKIHCACEGKGEYEVGVSGESVTVRCKKCGRRIEIPAGSTIAANAFLHTDELTLK